ncbi:MAG: thymidylate synthase [Methanothermococcus sp.]|jgi:hypothetical protein|uniref:DUF166 domain-containing protein n=1 Tax=Methanothermococcus TaxID=155862 RepID=UPI000368E50C|nr:MULTISPECIES: DUF166 domain-containing protein [Methanothermococcus]MDK2790116.1 thymidylate synthase [Methanothermococcus sp.]MDK2988341.1 thymidylate synthase [Methanothermococcus sp.]
MKVTFIYHEGNKRMEKFYKNLLNEPDFCRICEDCYNCRGDWSFKDNVNVLEVKKAYEEFIDNPYEYIPEVPEGDVCIAQLHDDLLYELPLFLKEKNYRALIVPSEAPDDLSIAMRNSLKEMCENNGIEFENPKPFCSLKKVEGKNAINEFIEYFRIGAPEIEAEVVGHTIKDVKVKISSPCGETYYIAKRIKNKGIRELKDEIANAHHNYPCLGSMEYDKELEDTILHEAGYIAIDSIKKALSSHKCKNKFCSKGCGGFL